MKTKEKKEELLPNKSLVHTAREVIRAINHDKRQAILQYIMAHPKCNVNAIYKTLGLEQSITSNFLHQLADAGIVKLEDTGRCVQVEVDQNKLMHVYRWVANLHDIMQKYVKEPKFRLTKKVNQSMFTLKQVTVSEKAVRSVVHLLNSLENNDQRKILKVLLEHDQPLCVTDLYIKTRADQAPTSGKLSLMKKVGLVSARRQGKHILYQADSAYVHELRTYIESTPI